MRVSISIAVLTLVLLVAGLFAGRRLQSTDNLPEDLQSFPAIPGLTAIEDFGACGSEECSISRTYSVSNENVCESAVTSAKIMLSLGLDDLSVEQIEENCNAERPGILWLSDTGSRAWAFRLTEVDPPLVNMALVTR